VAETISFGDTAERLLEVALVIVVGVGLASHWDVRGLAIGLVMFVIVRPLFTQLVLAGTPTSRTQRWLLGWFGVRGIGSLYYLSYALNHGLAPRAGSELACITLTVLVTSIVLHGITAQPLLSRYERLRSARIERRA
jgi:NhaP-type Na+/H+ or K+/H+ antiporter